MSALPTLRLLGSAAGIRLGGGASVRRPPELAVEEELISGVAGKVVGVECEDGLHGLLAVDSQARDPNSEDSRGVNELRGS